MKIIQSFWSAGKDVYADGFGWKHPELHFMSWALSCLSLREHYDDVTLYTDSAGYDVLINKLRLPYTRVEVCFDNLKCLPRYWGYTKILAYARQSGPFVYIDSDIYLPRPLPKRLERAALVAQNREYGTAYYKSMTNDMLSRPGLRIPPELYDGVAAESVASYNMGLFGGRDTAFIRRFCDTVFRFMDDNDLHNPLGKNSTANCNLVMEQIFFAVMADNEHRKVEGIVPRTMRDNGYTREEFCNLSRYEKSRYFHLLGGHKRNASVCAMLPKTLLRLYPEYYRRVTELFPWRNTAVCAEAGSFIPVPPAPCGVSEYDAFLSRTAGEYRALPLRDVWDEELLSAQSLTFLARTMRERQAAVLQSRKHLHVTALPALGGDKEAALIQRLGGRPGSVAADVAVFPQVGGNGLHEVLLGDMACNIISLLDRPLTLRELTANVLPCFGKGLGLTMRQKRECVMREAARLVFEGLLTVAG